MVLNGEKSPPNILSEMPQLNELPSLAELEKAIDYRQVKIHEWRYHVTRPSC